MPVRTWKTCVTSGTLAAVTVAEGEVGEIYLRTASTFIGYWDNPEATAEEIRPFSPEAECVVVAPGRREGRSYAETRDLAARALTEVIEKTTQSGVRIALEPIIAWQSDYLNTLAEAIELIDLVGHPSLGAYVDSFHLWRTGTLLEDIERAGPRIFGMHLNDAADGDDHANRLPGEGNLPLVEIVQAIEATGYGGTYDNEYMYDAGLIDSDPAFAPATVVDRCARAMVDVLSEAGIRTGAAA